jgi:hypothetical protein
MAHRRRGDSAAPDAAINRLSADDGYLRPLATTAAVATGFVYPGENGSAAIITGWRARQAPKVF